MNPTFLFYRLSCWGRFHRRYWQIRLLCLAIVVGWFGVGWACLSTAAAQSLPPIGAPPLLTNFPEITIRERCDGMSAATGETTLMVAEDGIIRGITNQTHQLIRPETQTAIFIDLFDNKGAVIGPLGNGLEELYRLYESNIFTVTMDQLAVFIPATEDTLDTVTDWTGDAGKVVKDVREITTARPFSALNRTALTTLLRTTLTHFSPSAVDMRQTLLVFSDGSDVISSAALDDLIREAQTRRIQIHTFFVDTGYNGAANLLRLSHETGGNYQIFTNPLAWQALWRPLVTSYPVCTITYRTSKVQPQELTLWEVISGTVHFTQTYSLPTITITAPIVTIKAPPMGATLLLTPTSVAGHTYSQTVNLAVAWDFASQAPRNIQHIMYAIQGPTPQSPMTVDSPPLPLQALTIPIPVADLWPGAYSVKVQIVDELGLQGEANVPFALLLPPTPTATPTPTALATATPGPTVSLTPTFTPTIAWYVEPIEWTKTDFPYRVLLIFALPLLGLLSYGAYNFRRQIMLLRDWQMPLAPSVAGRKVKAILYRVDSHPDLALQQVVKLSDQSDEITRLPEHLYTYRGEKPSSVESKEDSISAFHAQIVLNDYRYQLLLEADSKPIKYKRRNTEVLIENELLLENNDILVLGPVQYAFYLVSETFVPPQASSNAALPG